jgi:hypothetical protein
MYYSSKFQVLTETFLLGIYTVYKPVNFVTADWNSDGILEFSGFLHIISDIEIDE